MTSVVRLCALAALFWFVLFSPWTAPRLNFWLVMAMATAVLSAAGLWLQRAHLREIYAFRPSHVLIGLASALILYAVFWVGNLVSTQVFQFAKPEIAGIYSIRAQASPLVIGLLLLFWVGPAEEIFWRGFVQERLYERYGGMGGYLVASLVYAAIHVFGFNFMLFMASLICGLFWGAMYLRYRSVWPGLISHAVWDVLIFVVIPVQ
ncbi:MAG: CAAX amino terminal protease self- immunity [Syntrophaceae bacterium PtaB.Bin038]|nr:MAG: CAAX amino terminal protease self- immunity [Syntrophaceae bacterium PtaB.Bin038]